MSKIKDNAILTLNDFYKIKETYKLLSINKSTLFNLNKKNYIFFKKALQIRIK